MFSKADKKELKSLRKIVSEFDKKLREERKKLKKSGKSYEEIKDFVRSEYAERLYYTDGIDALESKQIFNQIEKYNIPQPEDVNYYDTVNTGYTKVLTENAKRILRQKIRDEKRKM